MLRSARNQYRGINAHLHSQWQASGGWGGFHTIHLGDLCKTLSAALLPMGYTAGFEDAQPGSLTIYQRDDYATQVGRPVAWVELVSPRDKGKSGEMYRTKRMNLMMTGLVFVEIDYLHETPPTFNTLPTYGQSPEAHPYRVIVIDPRPNFEAARAEIVEFDVDDPLPTIEIPLLGRDVLTFDLNAPYRKTFEEGLYGRMVDYAKLPLHFDRYTASDQVRIANRMLAVAEASRAGADLEAGYPLIVPDVPLDEALGRLKALG
jgi:hypothetical protein